MGTFVGENFPVPVLVFLVDPIIDGAKVKLDELATLTVGLTKVELPNIVGEIDVDV